MHPKTAALLFILVTLLLLIAAATSGCSIGLGEERHLHARLAHVESAEVEGIATRLGNGDDAANIARILAVLLRGSD
jgi:hypothetical protein